MFCCLSWHPKQQDILVYMVMIRKSLVAIRSKHDRREDLPEKPCEHVLNISICCACGDILSCSPAVQSLKHIFHWHRELWCRVLLCRLSASGVDPRLLCLCLRYCHSSGSAAGLEQLHFSADGGERGRSDLSLWMLEQSATWSNSSTAKWLVIYTFSNGCKCSCFDIGLCSHFFPTCSSAENHREIDH